MCEHHVSIRYALMHKCWMPTPEQRPSFDEIVEQTEYIQKSCITPRELEEKVKTILSSHD